MPKLTYGMYFIHFF